MQRLENASASGGGQALANGIFPAQMLRAAVQSGVIHSEVYRIPDANLQPASLDLRLGERAYRLRCSFLPDQRAVDEKLDDFSMDEIDLRDGAVLEKNCPYLIPLIEELRLPDAVRARTNPKSSTGRLDIFTRVITDRSHRFDEISPGYQGRLYLEFFSRSFTVRVKTGLALNQLRLLRGEDTATDSDIVGVHRAEPILFSEGEPVPPAKVLTGRGVFLGLDLKREGPIGFRAKKNSALLDLSLSGQYAPEDFWEQVRGERGGRFVLEPEEFYLLLSKESVRIPPEFAAEMIAYDPTSGELRTHYAGFFDPGFGHSLGGERRGSHAVLEVRAHDVPFMIEDGQKVCQLAFERMVEPPDVLYGEQIGSHYQGQELMLSKHFRAP